jgi:hypothetical protein
MRKKELRARNDALRREFAEANQLAAGQVKRINELRMEIAFLERDRKMANDHNGQGAIDPPSPHAQEPDVKACPDCAESVRSAARKCRYCGYRFDAVEASWNGRESRDGASNGSAPVARLGTVSGS